MRIQMKCIAKRVIGPAHVQIHRCTHSSTVQIGLLLGESTYCQPPPRALYSWTRDKSSLRFVCARLSSALKREVSANRALSSVSTPPSYLKWARREASCKELTSNSC